MLKYIIIGLSFIGTVFSASFAQRSAQSVMKVTASVVSGATVMHQNPASVDLQLLYDSGIKTNMGTLSIKSNIYSRVDVISSPEILIVNEMGEQVPVALTSETSGSVGNRVYRYSGNIGSSSRLNGTYYGEHNTVVLYN